MEKIDGEIKNACVEYKDFPAHAGEEVVFKGMIHRIREMTGFAFVIVRTARDVVQCVYSPDFSDYRMDERVAEGCAVKITGKIVKDQTREDRYELQIHGIEVLSTPAEQMPIVINKKQLDNIPLDLNLNMRPVTLRNPKERAVFKIQEGIARGFREFLFSQRFTEIRTPKINAQGAEGPRAHSFTNRCSCPSMSASLKWGPSSAPNITIPPAISTNISAWIWKWASSTVSMTS